MRASNVQTVGVRLVKRQDTVADLLDIFLWDYLVLHFLELAASQRRDLVSLALVRVAEVWGSLFQGEGGGTDHRIWSLVSKAFLNNHIREDSPH